MYLLIISKGCHYKLPPANNLHHTSLPSASTVLIKLNYYVLRLEDFGCCPCSCTGASIWCHFRTNGGRRTWIQQSCTSELKAVLFHAKQAQGSCNHSGPRGGEGFWRDSPAEGQVLLMHEISTSPKRRTTVGRTPLDEWSTLRTQPCLRGIRIRDLSTRAAADPRFRPRGHRDRQATSVLGGFGGQRWTSTGFHQRIYRGIRCTGGCTGPCVRFTKIRKFSPLYRISNHGPFSMYGVPIPTEVSGTSGV